MSYAEYLRRKAASTPTVVDTRVNTDASMHIMKTRMLTNRVFFTGARVGVINNVNNPSITPSSNDAVRSYVKQSGGSIPDASAFTAFVGGNAVGEEGIKANSVMGKITLPANLPAGLCTNAYRNGPIAPKSAGDWTRGQTPCVNGREPHIQNELGPSLFVDDTITLKHLTSCCDGGTQTPINNAIHTHPQPTSRSYVSNRPKKSAQPILVTPSPSDARKVGAALRKIPYVEKHRGPSMFSFVPIFDWIFTPRSVAIAFFAGIASSADGMKLVACAFGSQIYTSVDGGVSWTPRESVRNWSRVASSADGNKLVALLDSSAQLLTSTDSGVNWTARDSSRSWSDVASSADGNKLVAVVSGSRILTSTDSGVSWIARDSDRSWWRVASSADGNNLVAVVFGGQIYTSTNSGTTWTPRESSRNWYGVASSADGTKLVAVVNNGQIFTSGDSGVSWTPREISRNWWSVASSADGNKLVAIVQNGQIFTSTDSGVTWTPQETSRNWNQVTSSADGNRLAFTVTIPSSPNRIFTGVFGQIN